MQALQFLASRFQSPTRRGFSTASSCGHANPDSVREGTPAVVI